MSQPSHRSPAVSFSARKVPAALLSVLLLASCSAVNPSISQAPGTETANDDLKLSLDAGQLSPAFDPNVHSYDVSSLTTLKPVNFTISSAKASSATLDGKPVPLSGGSLSLSLDKLSVDRNLELKVSYGSRTESYQIHTVPQTFPRYALKQTDPQAVAAGWTFMAPGDWSGKNPSYLMILDPQSQPVYYLQSSNALADFKRQTLADGSVRYTYFEQTHANSIPKVGYSEGKIHVLDQNFQERAVLSLMPYFSSEYNEDYRALDADSHDSLMLSDNDYIVVSYYGKEVNNIPPELMTKPGKVKVAAAVIQEIRDGQVVFHWDSSQYAEFYGNAGIYKSYDPDSPDWYDYMHINSVTVDPKDQNLIVSFRHQNQIVKLDRKTGKILWRLGGKSSDFPLTAAQSFSHQHHAELLPSGDLMLFDNDNPPDDSPGNGQSKVMRFKLDEINHQVLDFQAWQPIPGQYGYAMGSAEQLSNGNLLIGWGANTNNSDVTEINPQGQVLSDLSFDEGVFSYRVFKYDQL